MATNRNYDDRTLHVWEESGIKIPDGSGARITMKESVDSGVIPTRENLQRVTDWIVEAVFLAYGNPGQVAAHKIKKLDDIKQSLRDEGIRPGDETREIETRIATLREEMTAINPLYVPGVANKPHHDYIHGLCRAWLAITGERPGVSGGGPFHEFVKAVTKHFRPGTKVLSVETIRIARNEWETHQNEGAEKPGLKYKI